MKKTFALQRKHFAIPYTVFLAVLVVFPLILILVFALTNEAGKFTFANIAMIFSSGSLLVFFKSFGIGLLTTVICILLGYPIAYICAQKKYSMPRIMVFLFVLPMWVNFLLRTLATKFLFEFIHVPSGYFTVIFGMVYNFLPFMILPIYTTLINLDKNLVEAAQDLGSSPNRVFFNTVIPLSLPGVVSGVLMVFMPCLSTLAISDILSNNKIKLFGNYIDMWFRYDGWNIGAAMSLLLLVLIGLAMWLSSKLGSKGAAAKGGLW